MAVLKQFIEVGAIWIHIINLDGALSGNFRKNISYPVILDLIKFSKKAGIKIQIGGGIQNLEIIEDLIKRKTDRIILGTIAFNDDKLLKVLSKNYKDKIAIALDSYNRTIRIKGWQFDTKLDIFEFFSKLENLGISNFIVTDIMKDGTSTGLDTNLYIELKKIQKNHTKIIASGGISSINNVKEALKIADGVIVGKALYNGNIPLKILGSFLD